MKRTFLITFLFAFAGLVWADDSIQASVDTLQATVVQPRIMQAMENVQFFGDEQVTRLLADKIDGTQREEVQIQGYRVQVFSSNQGQAAKAEAFNVQRQLEEAGLDTDCYVLFNPPFWKVRVGNFRTQDEANLMKEEIIRKLPDLQGNTYVVRDQITVLQ